MNPNNWLVKILADELGIDMPTTERIAAIIIDSLPLQAMTEAAAGSLEAQFTAGHILRGPAARNIVQAIVLALGEAS